MRIFSGMYVAFVGFIFSAVYVIHVHRIDQVDRDRCGRIGKACTGSSESPTAAIVKRYASSCRAVVMVAVLVRVCLLLLFEEVLMARRPVMKRAIFCRTRQSRARSEKEVS
jgi:hypothetical protein